MGEGIRDQLWVLGHKIRPLETDSSYGMIEVVSSPGVPGSAHGRAEHKFTADADADYAGADSGAHGTTDDGADRGANNTSNGGTKLRPKYPADGDAVGCAIGGADARTHGGLAALRWASGVPRRSARVFCRQELRRHVFWCFRLPADDTSRPG